MPYTVQLPYLPAGYTLTSVQLGEMVSFVYQEFVSSEDGDLFISRLEGFPTQLIQLLPAEVKADPATTKSLLAILHRDKTATVYYNEYSPVVQIRSRRDIVQKGDPVYLDDILDIERLSLDDIPISETDGICYIFSHKWRKALFFDYGPILEGGHEVVRDYDLGASLGAYYSHLLFQNLFKISDAAWEELFKQGWFPFIYLNKESIKSIINLAESQFSIDQKLGEISAQVTDLVENQIESWRKQTILGAHIEFITTALDRFRERDFISATSILFPRIEGIMRSFHLNIRPADRMTQQNLASSAAGGQAFQGREKSLLLPDKFRRYLEEVYFANFDPQSPEGLSRNTISHGVAQKELFDEKSSVLGFLILLQVSILGRG